MSKPYPQRGVGGVCSSDRIDLDDACPVVDVALPVVVVSHGDHSTVGPNSYCAIAARCDLDDADPATNIDTSRCPALSSLTMSSLIAAMSGKITLPLTLLQDCLNETSPIIHGLVTLNLSGSRSNLVRACNVLSAGGQPCAPR
jgi:hypothetical protein